MIEVGVNMPAAHCPLGRWGRWPGDQPNPEAAVDVQTDGATMRVLIALIMLAATAALVVHRSPAPPVAPGWTASTDPSDPAYLPPPGRVPATSAALPVAADD